MCLYTYFKTPSIAKYDIPIWKVVIAKNNVYYAPYARTLVGLNAKGSKNVEKTTYSGIYSVSSGYIHAYKDESSAEQAANRFLFNTDKVLVIKGYIPKGTKYYEGGQRPVQICAAKVKYKFLEEMSTFQKLIYFLHKKKI